MEVQLAAADLPAPQRMQVSLLTDVSEARRAARAMALRLGFEDQAGEEIALVASELASNLVRHARGGTLAFSPISSGTRAGIEITSADEGPGIPNVDHALADGVSTAGGLGYGLGTVNRLMDELDVDSERGRGTRIVCRRWRRPDPSPVSISPLSIGAASRPRLGNQQNGDSYVAQQWGESALVGVIDGLGHGEMAFHASEAARQYVEVHYDQPLDSIFRGAGIVCRSTRGAVMALARIDRASLRLSFASIGNVEARVVDCQNPPTLLGRRGILGVNAPAAAVTESPWDPRGVMILHSDGVSARWTWNDFAHLASRPATIIARELLNALARDEDDATVIVVKRAEGEA